MGILALGLVLRLLAIVSWWPVTPTLDDGYQRFASNPFLDPQHPAGYGLIVAALGHLSRRVAFTVGLQHVIGLVSAVVLWRAARRVCVSRWAALLVLALMTLDPDLIFLEHSIMSESWAVLTIVLALYATVRCCERPGGRSGWLWALGSGTALAAGVMIRSATLPLVPVIAIAVLCWEPGAWRAWRTNVRAAALLVATVVVLLLGFASANAAFGQRFGIAPSPGWYLYGRVAQFADCSRFDPPAGTRALCQTTAPEQRPSAYVYEFGAGSPAIRRFGAFGSHDALVGAWAKRALAAQPGDALQTAWSYLRAYWVPSTLPARLRATSDGLDPQLQFTYANPYFVDAIHRDLARFYAPFSVHPWHPGLEILAAFEHVTRFGATMLFVCTVLLALGAIVGTRRARAALWLFGVGGLSLIIASVATGTYSGRYTVPMAPPMIVAAAISLGELARASSQRARARRTSAAPATTVVGRHVDR